MPDQFLSNWKPKYTLPGEMSADEPTWRERAASMGQSLLEGLGEDRYRARKVADTIVGGPSSGLPGGMGIADLTPVGWAMSLQESGLQAGRGVARGDPVEAGLGALGGVASGLPLASTATKGLQAAGKAVATPGSVANRVAYRAAEQIRPFTMLDAAAPKIFVGDEGVFGKKYANELAMAKQKESRGEEMNAIRTQTGWFRDPADGHWKYEISDKDSLFTMLQMQHQKDRAPLKDIAKKLEDSQYLRILAQRQYGDATRITPDIVELFKHVSGEEPHPQAMGIAQSVNPTIVRQELADLKNKLRAPNEYKASDVIHHPELFEAYPQAKNWKIQVTSDLPKEIGGDQLGDRIRINRNLMGDKDQARSIMLHEMEHGVQDIEGHGSGGSAKGIIDAAEREVDKLRRPGDILANALNVRKYMAAHGVDAEEAIRQIGAANSHAGSLASFNRSSHKIRELAEETDISDERLVTAAKKAYENAKQVKIPTQKEATDAYMHLPGEAMSRNVQARADFTAYQRQTHDPLKHTSEGGTLDVKPEDIKAWKPAYQMVGSPAMPKSAVTKHYHGGRAFDQWDPKTIGSGEGMLVGGPGLYVGDTPTLAKMYTKYGGENARLSELNVDTTRFFNPARKMTNEQKAAYDRAVEKLDALGLRASSRGLRGALRDVPPHQREKVRQAMVDSGIDGLHEHLNETFGTETVIFNPDVIRKISKHTLSDAPN